MAGIFEYFFGQADPKRKEFFDNARQQLDEELYGTGRVTNMVDKYPDTPEMRRANAVRDAAFPRVVTAPLETINLIKQIYDATQVPDLPVHEQSDSAIARGLERLGRAKYGPDGFEKLVEGIATRVHERKLQGDARTEQEIAKEFMASPEYEGFQQQFMPTLGRYTEKAANAIDRTFGAPIDEDKNLPEKMATAAAQAYVPTKGVNLLIDAVGGGTKSKILADILVPGTSNYTGKGVAANAALGAGVVAATDLGIEALTDEQPETPADIDVEDTPSPSEQSHSLLNALPSITSLALPALGIAAAGANPKVAKEAAESAVEAVVKRRYGNKEFVSGGNSRTPELAVSPTVRTKTDELAPVEDTLARVTEDRAAATAATRDMTRYMRGNQAVEVDHWRTTGHLEGLDRTTISQREFEFHRNALDQMGELEAFNEYMLAQTALDSRKAALQNALSRRDKLIAEIDTLEAANSFKKAAEKEKELIKALEDERAVRADIEEGRPSLRGRATEELMQIVEQGKLKEHFVKTEELFKKFADDFLEYGKKNGVFGDDDITRMKGANPNYIPLKEDPLGAAVGGNRLLQKVKNKLGLNENPYGEDAEFMRSFNPFSSRELFDNESAVNNPLNPFDAVDLYAERMIRFVNREKMKSSFIDQLKGAVNDAENTLLTPGKSADDLKNAQEVSMRGRKEFVQFEHNGQKSFSVSQVKAMIGQGLDFSNYVSRLKNGRVEFYKFRDPLVHIALQHQPLVTVPILRDVSRIFRNFTTGTLNPGFAPVSFAYDTRTTNLTRPVDSVYGLDYLVDKATLGKSPQFVKSIARAAATNYDPVAYGLNLSTALTSWIKQNGKFIGDKIVSDLSRESGLFNALAQIPEMKPMLEGLGQTMVSAFENSIYGTMVYNHAADAAVLSNMTNHVRDIDRLVTARMPDWAKVVGGPAYFAVQQYRMMLSSVHSAARVGYVLRNPHLYTDANGKVNKVKLKKIMNDVRTMGGDFAKKPGSPVLQGFDSASPYFNVMLRSTQNIWQRMRDDPRLLGLMFTGVMMPKLYSDYVMSNWDKEAYDYYWRKMPEWKRVGTIILPHPNTLFAWMRGERVPFSEDAIVTLITVPEMRPISEAVSQGVRAMGFYGAGQADRLTGGQTLGSALSAIGEGMKQAFSPMTPPLVNLPLAPAGVQIDVGNVFKGENPVQTRQSGAATRSGVGETMTVGSEISKSFADTIGAMFGTAATRLTQAFDTGAERYEHSGSVLDALYGAGEEFLQRTTDLREDVPLVAKATEKVYRGNPVGQHAAKLRSAIETVVSRDGVQKPVGVPVLDQIAFNLRMMARNNFEYKAFRKTYFALKDQLDATDANKSMSYNERLTARNAVLKKMYELDVQQSQFLTNMETRIAKAMGGEYKQMFGTDFTFADFAEQIKKANRNKKGSTLQ